MDNKLFEKLRQLKQHIQTGQEAGSFNRTQQFLQTPPRRRLLSSVGAGAPQNSICFVDLITR
jgi:hypothetical protein